MFPRSRQFPGVFAVTLLFAAFGAGWTSLYADPDNDATVPVDNPPAPFSLDAITIERDLVYKAVNSKPLALDLYLPSVPAPGNLPLMVYIHGGGYRKGSRSEIELHPFFSSALLELVARGEIALASIDFSKGSKRAPLSVIAKDCADAVSWLRGVAAERGLDADNVGIAGNESGGLLALLTALRPPDPDRGPALRLALAHAPATDMTRTAEAVADSEDPDMKKIRTQLKIGLGGTLEDVPENYHGASPVNFLSADSPPTLIFVGENDARREQADWFRDAAQSASANASVVILSGAGEDPWTVGAGSNPSTCDLKDSVQQFIRENLSAPAEANNSRVSAARIWNSTCSRAATP